MLTKDDLQSIKQIVDEAFDDSDRRTAAGFNEVHEKFAEVHGRFAEVHEKFEKMEIKIDNVHQDLSKKIEEVDSKLFVKDGKLENTVQRVDKHDKEITAIKKKLSLA